MPFFTSRFLLVMVIAALFSCGDNTAVDPATLNIAAIVNLTGPAAQFDAIKAKTLQIAKHRLDARYPKIKIRLDVFDAGGGPETTLASVSKAVALEPYAILSGTSPTALTIAGRIDSARLDAPMQLANAANPDFGPPKAGQFRFWPDWRDEARIISDLLQELKYKHVMLIHSTDPYSESLSASLRDLIDPEIKLEYFPFDPARAPDFRPSLLRAKNDAHALVIFGLPPAIRSLVNQMSEVDVNLPLVGGVNINLNINDFDTAELNSPLWGIQTPGMRFEETGGEANAFQKEFHSRYGEYAPFHALYLADALYFAVRKADLERRNAYADNQHFEIDGASGKFEVASSGIVHFEMGAVRLR